jgi:isoquinoline 1-oxidoreductase beta subunit
MRLTTRPLTRAAAWANKHPTTVFAMLMTVLALGPICLLLAYEKMRLAGAVARDVLLQAAAKRTGIAKEELKTSNGSVITPRGEALSYSSLAADAARIDTPKDVRLKPEAEWRYLGKAMQRIDIVAKSTGTATFGIDIKMPGMAYATVRTNPRIGGGINGFDASAAERSRGVVAIVPVTGGVGAIADNTWRAFKAANLITCDWGPSPYP